MYNVTDEAIQSAMMYWVTWEHELLQLATLYNMHLVRAAASYMCTEVN